MDVTKIPIEILLGHPYVQELHQIIYKMQSEIDAMKGMFHLLGYTSLRNFESFSQSFAKKKM